MSLGANLCNPILKLVEAVRRLHAASSDLVVSSLYRSAPVGFADQPDFHNVVCRLQTRTVPADLLLVTKRIENDLGRTRSFANSPRAIDIDLLAYEDVVLDTPELVLPHPRLHQRAFVLSPLAEIAPAWRHPVFDKTPAELMAAAGPLERIERIGPLQG